MIVIYDIETYKCLFTCVLKNAETGQIKVFEVSNRRNDIRPLMSALAQLKKMSAKMVGFNNQGFDYPVLHTLATFNKAKPNATHEQVIECAWNKANEIINGDFNRRFAHIIPERRELVKQIDLYKIHHFDNVSRATSLKVLEFNMHSSNIGELPYPPESDHLSEDQIDEIIEYNIHDVNETHRFYDKSLDALKLRKDLGKKYNRDFTNFNDTKIGKQIFIMALEESIGENACYYFTEDRKRHIRQTKRESIKLGDVILPYVQFGRPEFCAVHEWLQNRTITETKGVLTEIPFDEVDDLLFYGNMRPKNGKLKNVNVISDGVQFDFGTGGLHASVENKTFVAGNGYKILDLDVTSYYPSLAIVNRFFPEHLSEEFCNVYDKLKKRRVNYAKGTPENAALKLALNGVYGDSNNQYSPFYDPQYTMSITINGQLLLTMLAEQLMDIQECELIQANTDGVTVYIPEHIEEQVWKVAKSWQELTGLELEHAYYNRMWIRDVNNYIAEYVSGDLKRKGAYEHDVQWHQNHSSLVVPKAAEAYLVHGIDVEEFIRNHDDMYDFYSRTKLDRNCQLIGRDETFGDTMHQRVSRYYVSNGGEQLVKIMPPLKKKRITKKMQTSAKKLGIEWGEEEWKEFLTTLQPDETCFGESEAERKLWEEYRAKPRETKIESGYTCTVDNENDDDFAMKSDINYDYYIAEAKKLTQSV